MVHDRAIVTIADKKKGLRLCLFVFVVVCLVLFSLVAAAFLANKDVYIYPYS